MAVAASPTTAGASKSNSYCPLEIQLSFVLERPNFTNPMLERVLEEDRSDGNVCTISYSNNNYIFHRGNTSTGISAFPGLSRVQFVHFETRKRVCNVVILFSVAFIHMSLPFPVLWIKAASADSWTSLQKYK